MFVVSTKWLKVVVLLVFFAQTTLALAVPCSSHLHSQSHLSDQHSPKVDHHHCDEIAPADTTSVDSLSDCCGAGFLCPSVNSIGYVPQVVADVNPHAGFSLVFNLHTSFVPDEPVFSLYRPPIV
ncbi:hypothetical protein DWB84_03230 [Saccharophagus sp. K07]|nr:hypothetical protein [Saccharophagus sp. K07]